METFGFFEAIAHEDTRTQQSHPSPQQFSNATSGKTHAKPSTSTAAEAKQPETVVDDDQTFAWWGMF